MGLEPMGECPKEINLESIKKLFWIISRLLRNALDFSKNIFNIPVISDIQSLGSSASTSGWISGNDTWEETGKAGKLGVCLHEG